jgi:tripeptide aminopeptidase
MIDAGRLLATFLDMAAIDSLSFRERAAADYVTGVLSAAGISVYEDNAAAAIHGTAGNLIARLPGTAPGPTIMLASHLDTVAPGEGVRPVLKDGYVVSEGDTVLGADDKAGAAVILELLRRLTEENHPHPEIIAIFTVAEEVGLVGAQALDYRAFHADLGFVFDDGGPVGRITVQAPYQDHFSCVFTGRAAHAGIEPEDGVSAIAAAAKAIDRMSLGRLDADTTANIGLIEGGAAINIVPARAVITGEARSHSLEKLRAQTARMGEACAAAAAATGAKQKTTVKRLYDGFDLSDDHPAVSRAVAAVKAAGLKPLTGKSGGGSDTNVFNAHGIPAVNIGVGYERVHTPEERLPVEALRQALAVALNLVTGEGS